MTADDAAIDTVVTVETATYMMSLLLLAAPPVAFHPEVSRSHVTA